VNHARDIMQPAKVVRPDTRLTDLAQELLTSGADAVCVAEAGRLVGVLTGMDLVYREKRVHAPVTITLLDLVFQLGGHRTEREIEKMSAMIVTDLMTREVITVAPGTPLDEVATQMVEKHLSIVPVVEDDRLVGVVTRRAMVEVALRHLLAVGGPKPAK
jgi:CBS domain-containing protein